MEFHHKGPTIRLKIGKSTRSPRALISFAAGPAGAPDRRVVVPAAVRRAKVAEGPGS